MGCVFWFLTSLRKGPNLDDLQGSNTLGAFGWRVSSPLIHSQRPRWGERAASVSG